MASIPSLLARNHAPASLLAGLAVLLVPCPCRAQPGPPEQAQESHWLRGEATERADFQLYGPDAESCVQFEPAGAHITLPATFAKARPFTGLVRQMNVQGDFDVMVDFEILHESEPAPPASFAIRLGLILQMEGRKTAVLSRTFAEGQKRFVMFYQWPDAAGTMKTQSNIERTQASRGRLRLVRTGTLLSYYAAEGPDQDFLALKQYEIGADDLKDIRVAGQTGGLQAALEGRFTNLRLRTGPAQPPEARPPQVPDVPAAAGARGLKLVLAAVVVIALALGIGLTVFRSRQRGGPRSEEHP